MKKKDVYYKLSDSTNVATAFRDETMISLHGADKPIPDERFTESTVHTTEDKLWLPIHYPPPPGSGVSKGQTIGVLRALNHISTVRGQAQAFQFSWEEFSLLGFLAEVIGIIAFQYHRVSKQPEILERLLHGVQAQALATIQELNQLQERANPAFPI